MTLGTRPPMSTAGTCLRPAVLMCNRCAVCRHIVNHAQPQPCAWQAGVGETGDVSSPEASPDFERARSAAKALLETHRDCLPLWAAYARLETAAGQHRCHQAAFNTSCAQW